jgi:signal transduction histidine kinase
MNVIALKQRVQARDRLVLSAENAGLELHQQALAALNRGDLMGAEAAILRNDANVRTLVENLRIYQAELHAQAAELDEGHARIEELLTRFSALFANMPVAAMLVAFSGVVLESNGRAATLFALQARGVASRFLHRLVDNAQYQNLVRPAFLRAGADAVTSLDAIDFIAEDGRRFSGELHIAALPARAGEATQYAVAVIDRSEQLEARRAQELSRQRIDELSERLALAIDAGGIGTWFWADGHADLAGDERMLRLIARSNGTSTQTPLTAADDLALGLAGALADGEWPRLHSALVRALHGEALDIELQLQGLPPRHLHLSGRGHDGRDGRPRGVLGCARDCTVERESRRAEAARESAEIANRAKSAFLSRMSHELRTPLNAILGFSQLMRMEAEAGDLIVKPHRATLIETAARHLLDLINEVLDVSRIEAGRMDVQLTRFELGQVLAECLPLVQGMADKEGIQLADHLDRRLPTWVRGDRLRLKEVLINLLSNAVKYNRPHGRVDVSVVLQGGRIELSVADTGHGLDERQQAALFEPFNRLGAEFTKVEGSGMGLFVSKRFIELMGATLAVHSTPGAGTTFTVSLASAAE